MGSRSRWSYNKVVSSPLDFAIGTLADGRTDAAGRQAGLIWKQLTIRGGSLDTPLAKRVPQSWHRYFLVYGKVGTSGSPLSITQRTLNPKWHQTVSIVALQTK